jgi:hypothetical protein
MREGLNTLTGMSRDDEAARKFDVPAGYVLVPKSHYHKQVRGAASWTIHKEREKLAGKPVAHVTAKEAS